MSEAAFDRAARVLRPGGAPPGASRLELRVDGTPVTLEAVEDRVRLRCVLSSPPADETGVRTLMASFLRHADRGAEVLAARLDGTLELVAELSAEDDIPALVARFCDAAAHWGCAAAAVRPALERLGSDRFIIRP